MQQAMDTIDFLPHYKVVLLGNSGCGKTSIICRYVSDQFATETKATVGGNHQRKRVILENGPVDLFIWDTAGQERFQALMPLYARSSDCAVVTVSINDSGSFQAIDQWVELIKSACSPIPPIVLAVNKMDDFEHCAMTIEEVSNTYRNKFKGIFFISALSGENVDQLFSFVALEAMRFSNVNTQVESIKEVAPTAKGSNCC